MLNQVNNQGALFGYDRLIGDEGTNMSPEGGTLQGHTWTNV